MNYHTKREELVKERKRLMDLLESQMDFPETKTLLEYEENKRAIIHLDSTQRAIMKFTRDLERLANLRECGVNVKEDYLLTVDALKSADVEMKKLVSVEAKNTK